MALYHQLPAAMRDHPGPTAADRKSFQAYRDWQARQGEVFPESELRNMYETNPTDPWASIRRLRASIERSVRARRSATTRGYVCQYWHFSRMVMAVSSTSRRTTRNGPHRRI